MNSWLAVLLLCALTFMATTHGRSHKHVAQELGGEPVQQANDDNSLRPLFLTQYIQSGRVEEGRQKARVRRFPSENVKSFSGYLTVNEEYQSNLFFWFFLAEKGHENAPLMIWLEGGPGEPGFYGVFVQNGPFKLNKRLKLESRRHSWTKMFNMLYIDQPVGSGYSFTRDDRGYARNLTQSTRDLYDALMQFFTLFPIFQANDFYVAGISYGGKFAAALTQHIIRENESGANINLKGVIIASGFIDPVAMVDNSDYYYQVGLIGNITLSWGKEQYEILLEEYNNGNLMAAGMIALGMNSRFLDVAGYKETADSLLLAKAPDDYFYYEEFVQKIPARRSLHVGKQTFNTYYGGGQVVIQHMIFDMINDIQEIMEDILNAPSLPILFLNGNMDISIAPEHLPSYLKKLNWPGAKIFRGTVPSVCVVNGDNAGHVTVADNVVHVLLRNAGHIVVHDQPEWSFHTVRRFLRGEFLDGTLTQYY